MKQVFKCDSNGYYLEPVILNDADNIPSDCTEIQPPNGLYKAQFVNGAWGESLTTEEINAIKNAPQPPTDMDDLKKQLADLSYTLMIAGVI